MRGRRDETHRHGPDVEGDRRRRHAFDDGRWAGPPWGGPGRGVGGGRGRGRGRARRGDVRAAVLALLAERPMHGYEIIGELAERTDGVWKPSPGSVYPTLQLLEDEGLVVGEEQDGKRRFSLTDEGRQKVADRGGPPPWDQITQGVDPGERDLWEAFRHVVMACRQVSAAGSPDQRRRAVEILTEARKKLYGILAED